MSKPKSMVYQVNQVFKEQIRFGESKHQAKQLAKLQGKSTVDGIFSISTYRSYIKRAIDFAQWARDWHGCRTLEEAKRFAGDYLLRNIRRGNSAWTLQLQRSALRKLYQDPNLVAEVKLPQRHKAEVKRSRGVKASDQNFSIKKNPSLVDFQHGVGLRRHELAALYPNDVFQSEGQAFVHVKQGKGGKMRNVPVLDEFKNHVLSVAEAAQPGELLFPSIPEHMDVHGYRREYAQNLYTETAGSNYVKGKPNKKAIAKVSNALGHNRTDVPIRSYLG